MNSTLIKGLILLPFLFLGTVIGEDRIPDYTPPETNPFVVVLDAGHGGHDPGNLGNGYQEKNIALKIVLAAGKELAKTKDIKVVYTRKDDSFVDLFVRGEIANKANADIFVSIHCDSHGSDAHGAGTFVLGLHANQQNFEIAKKENSVIYLEDDYETRYSEYDINSPESIIGLTIMQEEFLEKSILLARKMQQNFAGRLKRKDRQVKQAGFIVLHQTFMPSVLVETGFLTNRNEGAYLNSKKGQTDMGKAIADAILAYKNEVVPLASEGISERDIAEIPSTPTPAIDTGAPAEEQESIQEGSQDIGNADNETDQRNQSINKEINTPNEIVIAEKEEEKPVLKTEVVEKEEASTDSVPTREAVKEADVPEKEVTPELNKATDQALPEKEESTIEYRVQIMASAKKIELASQNFRGLNNMSREPYKNLYRYMYGKTPSYEQVKLFKANADAKGYTTSYIVAYKEGERVSVKEALAHQNRE